MAKKNKIISALGPTDYIPCNYVTKSGFTIQNCCFIQEALLKIYLPDIDEVVIFGTKGSYSKNWTALEKTFKDIQLEGEDFDYQFVTIPNGENEDEIWDIFEEVVDNIDENDSIYFDITHGFRFQPMLFLIILNYVKLIKNVTIEKVHYGMFGTLGSPHLVKEMPLCDRNAPILDLTPLILLNDWITATDSFISTGSLKKVFPLVDEEIRKVLRETKGGDELFSELKTLKNYLHDFNLSITTCRGNVLNQTIHQILKQLDTIEEYEEIANKAVLPFLKLMEKIKEKYSIFSFDDKLGVQNYLKAIEWCQEHDLILQSFIILRENIISFLLSELNQDIRDSYKRELMAKTINLISLKETPKGQSKEIDLLKSYQKFIQEIHPNVPPLFDKIKFYRNDMAHFGYVKAPISKPKKFNVKLSEIIRDLNFNKEMKEEDSND